MEQELNEVQQAMSQFEEEGDSQGDDLQLVDSQVKECVLYVFHPSIRITLYRSEILYCIICMVLIYITSIL